MAGAADISSNPDSGIVFLARDNSILTSFVFTNQGEADTVELTTPFSGSILDSVSVPSGTNPFTASVDWSLTAGDIYWLVSVDSSNGTFVSFDEYDESDTDMSVTESEFGGGGDQTTDLWANFTDIVTTTSAVPEPGAGALVASGIAVMLLVGLRRFAAKR